MEFRKYRHPRCGGCGLHDHLCACSILPRVQSNVPIVIVQHLCEGLKPTNTARLFRRMVEGCTLLPWVRRGEEFDPGPLADKGIVWTLLFPRADAVPMECTPGAEGRRRGFVLLDGTWRQCARMSRRVPFVKDFPCMALPAGASSRWPIRTQRHPAGLCTAEAGIRLLEMAGEIESSRLLGRALDCITARLLYMRGVLASPDPPEDWTPRGRGREARSPADPIGEDCL